MTSFSSILSLAFLSLLLSPLTNAQQATITITDTPSYKSAADCIQNCVWDKGDTGSDGNHDVIVALGCSSPWYNSCLCRTDATAAASSYISSCVMEMCSVTSQDPKSAVSLYDGYCGGANAVATATTTGGSQTGTGSAAVTAAASTKTGSVPAVTATGSTGAKTSSAGASIGLAGPRMWVFGAFALAMALMK
jgi:hypothetical protein